MSDSITWHGESGNLIEAEYIPSDRTFRVKFKDGTETMYTDVPIGILTSFVREGHKNSFLDMYIKGVYKPVMSEKEYARGQEAVRLLKQFRDFQKERHGLNWNDSGTIHGTSIAFDDSWVPAVNAVLDRK